MRRRLWPLSVAALVVAGVVLRAVFLRGRWGTLDSDEAIVGLMARSFLDGDWRAFYWGQHYGGTQETTLIALAGGSTAALKLVPAALSGVAAVLTWRVGRRLFADRLAQAAGLLCWVAPGSAVWWSTKGRGFYWAALVLGLCVVLFAQRLVAGRPEGRSGRWWPWLDGAALGVAGGLGFWATPNILYFALPAGIWLLVHRPAGLRWLATAVPAAVVGALPWLWHNLETGWLSLERPDQPEHVGYVDGIGRLLWRTLPMALNLRFPISELWLVEGVAPMAYVALGVLLVVAAVRRTERPVLLLLGLALFPFVYAWFPGAWFVGEGRYVVFAVPFLALAVAWMVRRPAVVVAVAAVSAVVSFVVVEPMGPERPRHLAGDLAALRDAGVDTMWGDYWIAYRLAFTSGGWLDGASWLTPRSEELRARVLADPTPAFIFRPGDERLDRLDRELDAPSRRLRTPHFAVLLVEEPVDPAALPAGLVP